MARTHSFAVTGPRWREITNRHVVDQPPTQRGYPSHLTRCCPRIGLDTRHPPRQKTPPLPPAHLAAAAASFNQQYTSSRRRAREKVHAGLLPAAARITQRTPPPASTGRSNTPEPTTFAAPEPRLRPAHRVAQLRPQGSGREHVAETVGVARHQVAGRRREGDEASVRRNRRVPPRQSEGCPGHRPS